MTELEAVATPRLKVMLILLGFLADIKKCGTQNEILELIDNVSGQIDNLYKKLK